jgi:dTMP kinase
MSEGSNKINKSNNHLGLFISVEGIDGAGKSTHVAFIQEYLESHGLQVITTREPGGTILGEKIRELLLDKSNYMHQITELLLLFASRQELIANTILPNLERGVCVVADRFIDASIAYQGGGRKIDADKIKQIISLLEPQIQTDLTFLFNVRLDVACQRIANRATKVMLTENITENKLPDRIEQEDVEFFERVQNAYLQIAESEPVRVKIIDTANLIEHSRDIIIKHLDQLIINHYKPHHKQ